MANIRDLGYTKIAVSQRFGHPHSQIPSVLGIPFSYYCSGLGIPRGILYFADWTGLVKRGLVKRGLVKRGLVKRGLVKRGLVKRGLVKRGLVKRGLVKRGLVKRKKMLALLTQLSTIQRTSQVKIRGIITLNINVYNTNKSTNKIHNLI